MELTDEDRRLLARWPSANGCPVKTLEMACRQMRTWALAGDWRYVYFEHKNLYAALQRLRAGRDHRLNATGPP